MKLKDAINSCAVRSAVRRKSNPNIKFWKNHTESINSRVPIEWQNADDWEEYDPREEDNSSLYMYND